MTDDEFMQPSITRTHATCPGNRPRLNVPRVLAPCAAFRTACTMGSGGGGDETGDEAPPPPLPPWPPPPLPPLGVSSSATPGKCMAGSVHPYEGSIHEPSSALASER